ncbi:hypothetical protein FXO37_12828 [Capsicum annuum]|nr:hypothetical protein FXO37_12828 [Capsicum annuum]
MNNFQACLQLADSGFKVIIVIFKASVEFLVFYELVGGLGSLGGLGVGIGSSVGGLGVVGIGGIGSDLSGIGCGVGSGLAGPSVATDLEDKTIPKQYREKLCLVWFVHSVILAKDVRKVIEDDLLVLADDFEKFNDYPWGYDNYYLTIKYLMTKLSPGRITLYEFPWAFMVVYPWIVPTEQKLGMTSFITLGLVDTTTYLTMELIKKELAGATAIRRAVRQGQPNVKALYDQPIATDSSVSSGVLLVELLMMWQPSSCCCCCQS